MVSIKLLLVIVISMPMASTADTEVVVLRAVRGRTARLPCGQGKVFLDGPSAYVLWLKNDRDFLYRYPNEDDFKSSKSWMQDLGCSTESGGCSDDTSLTIKHIEDSDEGLYRCRVHYQASPSQDYVIEVVLVGSPGMPKIYNEVNEEITKSYVGPYSLGADFTLVCEVKHGNAEDSETLVYWKRNGDILEKSTTKQENSLRSEITIKNISRDELNAHYECIAQNADITEPLIKSVVIKMYLPPLSVEIRLNNNVNFEAGSPRLVDCIVLGCVPPPAVTWHLDQQLIRPTSHKEVHEGNYTVSTLSLSPSVGRLARTLRCRAHNPHLPRHMYQDTITINVGYKPVCSSGITLVPKTTTERVSNDDLERVSETVTCQVESMPEPIQFTWKLPDSRTLVTAVKQTEGRPHLYTSTLTWIPKPDEIGTISCSASNIFGEQKRSCDFTLSASGIPQAPNCVLRKINEEDIKVHCETGWNSGRSQRISLEILSDTGSLLYNVTNTVGQFHLTSLPNFHNVSMRVFASNNIGTSPPVYLHLSSFASPSSTSNTSISPLWIWSSVASIFVVIIVIILLFCGLKSRKKELVQNPDIVPSPDGSFHREPELEREERMLGTTNITVNQLASCQNQYSSTPVLCRVRIGCHQTQNCEQNMYNKQSYYV